ncbi:hypothetical protein FHETE_10348 [Fusarium heterosporum]|uniref:Uncharacterized protein n=1 Tax=Fusarium heterosporum TaxID=42747 RepID=A0A8H5WGT8_FUSHE|nr:hypothetical protein FHETE_10348 [Fusarium heterosporum]
MSTIREIHRTLLGAHGNAMISEEDRDSYQHDYPINPISIPRWEDFLDKVSETCAFEEISPDTYLASLEEADRCFDKLDDAAILGLALLGCEALQVECIVGWDATECNGACRLISRNVLEEREVDFFLAIDKVIYLQEQTYMEVRHAILAILAVATIHDKRKVIALGRPWPPKTWCTTKSSAWRVRYKEGAEC